MYQTIIVQSLTYCGVMNLKLTFVERATKIIFKYFRTDSEIPSIIVSKKKRACELVKRILNGDIPDALKDNFVLKDHGRNTRNNGCHAGLPSELPFIKTEYARCGFFFKWKLKPITNSQWILGGNQILKNLRSY